MQVSDTVLVGIYIGGLYGLAWSDLTRFITFNLAGIGFFINLFTEIGGPFSIEVFLATLAIILGTWLWVGLDILGNILAILNAALTNVTTRGGYVHVPDTSTTNLKDVFFPSDRDDTDRREQRLRR